MIKQKFEPAKNTNKPKKILKKKKVAQVDLEK